MGLMDKLKGFVEKNPDKANQGMDKASEGAKKKFGHDEQVDKVTEKGKDYFSGGEKGGEPGGQSGQPPEQKPGPE